MNPKDLHTKVEETLGSLDGIKRAKISPDLFQKIENSLDKAPRENIFTFIELRRIAAAAVLFIGINIFCIYQYEKHQSQTDNSLSTVLYQKYLQPLNGYSF